MRYIGELSSEDEAARFTAFLVVNGVDSVVEATDGRWLIWVKDEDKTAVGRSKLEEFQANSDDPRYAQAVDEVELRAKEAAETLAESQRNTTQSQNKWRAQGRTLASVNGPRPAFVQTVIAMAILVTLVTRAGDRPTGLGLEMMESLSFATPADERKDDATASIRHGEFWRALTPIFLHFGFQHIFFNCLFFYLFARQIEWERGSYFLAWFVVVVGVAGNLGQGLVPPLLSGQFTSFGGLSGVVYGVFGYVWICSRTGQGRYAVSDLFVFLMLASFTLSWLGEFEIVSFMDTNVANWAHTLGLFAGMAWGMRGAN
jgi:GlpG protein